MSLQLIAKPTVPPMIYKNPHGLEEFDLSKYAALEDARPEKWALLIKSRLTISSLLDLEQSVYPRNEPDDVQKSLFRKLCAEPDTAVRTELMKEILDGRNSGAETSLTNLNKNLFDVQMEIFFDNPLTPLTHLSFLGFSNIWPGTPAVTPITAESVLRLERVVSEVKENFPDQLSTPVSDTDPAPQIHVIYDQPIDRILKLSSLYGIRHLAHVAIDLNRSDEEIRDDFNDLLRAYRKETSFKLAKITKETLRRWHINNILPYADLLLWSKWSKTPLKARDLEHLLFPSKVANDILKGTKNSYKEAFSHVTMNALLRSAQ